MVIFFLSFFLFALGAEKTTDALDEEDPKKYVYYMLHYNFGVILLFLGIGLLVFFRYYPLISRLMPASITLLIPRIPYLIPSPTAMSIPITVIHATILTIYLIVLIRIFLYPFWIDDIKFILCKKYELEDYFDELEGLKKPELNWKWLASRFYKWRLGWEASKNVIIELRDSKIDGLGVFAVNKIEEGDVVAEGIHKEDYNNLIPWSDFKSYERDLKDKIMSFCIGTPEGFIPLDPKRPLNFKRIPTDSYMNHSCNGNLGFNDEGDFIAIRDIPEGEELTYDYGLAESNPGFKIQCKCGSENCRKLVTGNDWKEKAFRSRNLNFMLPALRNKEI